MSRVLGALFLVFLASSGCRRHSDRQVDEGTRDAAVRVPSEDTVVDEGCPHRGLDGQCSHDAEKGSREDSPQATGLFGRPLGKSPKVPLAEILTSPEKFHKQQVRVDGHVTRACSRKGCWMELAVDASEGAPRCRVTFENYGFFVPKDSAGSHARLEGTVEVTQVKPDAVRHYESEGANFHAKEPDGSAREVRLVATGVLLERI